MKPPSNSTMPEFFLEQSVSSGGAQPSAKAIYQQRKNYGRTISSSGDISMYKVEHLTTFSLERKDGLLTVDESIRKLQLLDARGKIWTQEVYLNIDNKSVKLFDCESQEELENFPFTFVLHNHPVIDACSFNSVCVLIVKDPDQQSTDIHMFQCSGVPADVICADLNSAIRDFKSKKGKKVRPETLQRHRAAIEAASRLPPSGNVKERVAEWTNAIEAQSDQSPSPLNGQQEASMELIAFKIKRDVQVLNHALDDIELFVAVLQRSAQAAKDLSERPTKRRSSKRKNGTTGNGIMELRAKLPPKKVFRECFQKFKLCFNLLSRLDDHISDPNAVELAHYLFRPLAFIIETCCGPELARETETPLLHAETIVFLRRHALPKEVELWNDLGEFWTKSRSEFPKDMQFATYAPQFSSGWVPPPLPSIESEAQELAATIQVQANHVQRAEEEWKAGGANVEDALTALSPMPPPGAVPPRKQSIFAANHDPSAAFKQHVTNHVARNQAAQNPPPSPRKLCRATYDFTARNEHELTVRLDDLLDVLDDSKAWWKVRNKEGETGFVPENLMLMISPQHRNSEESNESSPRLPSPPMFFPEPKVPSPPPAPPVYATVKKISPPKQVHPVPTATALSTVQLNRTSLKPVKKTPSVKKEVKPVVISGTLQDELKDRVASQKKKNFVLPKKKGGASNAVSINKHSTKAQVKSWLQSRGFSRITVDSLGVLNGAQIFSLKKEELLQISEDEGSRVYSQLNIQRSMDGFHTATERSELGRIMLRRRQEVEDDEDDQY